MENAFQQIKTLLKHKKAFRKLHPPISCESIKEIEENFHFLLPAEYREFISKMGNGGSLSISEDDSIELTEFGGNLNFEHVQENFTLQDSWFTTNAEERDAFLKTENKGYLRIASSASDCGENWILVITGACRGEVWLMDHYGLLRLPGIHFKEWLNLCLNHQLPSKIEKLSALDREKRKSDSPLLDIQENIAHKNCKSIKWNPPISIDEVRSFEREHGVALPDEYVEFITKIADGCFHFKATNSKNQGGTMFRLQDFSALKRLNEPFPFDKNTEEIRTQFFRKYNRSNTIWQSELFAGVSQEQDTSSVWASPEYSLVPGVLPFAIYNDTGIVGMNTQALLVLNGPLKGQIWKAERFSLRPGKEDDTFYTWMLTMLRYGVI